MEGVSEVLEIFRAFDTELAQTFRSIGYVSMMMGLWIVFSKMLATNRPLRKVVFAAALHFTVVTIWSTIQSMGVSARGTTLNAMLTVTTGIGIYGFIVSMLALKDKNANDEALRALLQKEDKET